MQFKHVPQDRFVIDSLVRMIAASGGEAETAESYNTAVGCGIDELVKHNMRQLSQQESRAGGWQELLAVAVRQSTEQLQRELVSHHVTFDLAPYLHQSLESLESAAKEMSGLNRKLIESRGLKRIGEKTPVKMIDARRHYEVSELGLFGSIEGLLATPTAGVAALNVEGIQETFPTEGEWFPFEVRVEEFLFVIDDDGAVFISTENFPVELLDKAKSVLHKVAETLYGERQ